MDIRQWGNWAHHKFPLLFHHCFLHVLNHQVRPPYGHVVLLSHIGSVSILDTLILHNDLFFSSFSFNLIYASKLARDSFFCLTVFIDQCVIQDLDTWRMIEMAECQASLYHLLHKSQYRTKVVGSFLPSISTYKSYFVISLSFDLWHYKLWHLSLLKLLLLNKSHNDYILSKSRPCTIFPLAKQ